MSKKQPQKSKDELLVDLKSNPEFQAKLTFARDVFYPALINATTSIDDASVLLGGFNTMLMQEFLAFMKDKTMKDLKLSDKLDPFNEKFNESKALISIFDDMTVFDAKDHIEGMRNEIQLFLNEEAKNRPLSDLKTKWLDQI